MFSKRKKKKRRQIQDNLESNLKLVSLQKPVWEVHDLMPTSICTIQLMDVNQSRL